MVGVLVRDDEFAVFFFDEAGVVLISDDFLAETSLLISWVLRCLLSIARITELETLYVPTSATVLVFDWKRKYINDRMNSGAINISASVRLSRSISTKIRLVIVSIRI